MKPRTRDKTKEGQSIIVPSSVFLYTECTVSPPQCSWVHNVYYAYLVYKGAHWMNLGT